MKNKYKILKVPNLAVIYLPKNDGGKAITAVDIDDLVEINKYPGSWHLFEHGPTGHTYVRGWNGSDKPEPLLHRYIMEPERGQNTSHVNGNGLDNRRKNLANVPIGKTAREENSVKDILSKLSWIYLKSLNRGLS